jgi:hypothetical protein
MNLWGVAPFLAAAVLSGGIGGHLNASHHAASSPPASSSPSPTGSPSPGSSASSTPPPFSPPPSGVTPVLRQAGAGSQQWAVTILLADSMPACHGAAYYWLETTPPNSIPPRLLSPPSGKVTSAGSSCQVTLTFSGLHGIPTTAVLVLDQSGTLSLISLTVSRDVDLLLYLWIPLFAGLALAVVTVLWSLVKIGARYLGDPQANDQAGSRLLQHPIVASGAWTLGDSWATNISTGIVVLGSVFSVTAATSTLFPGVALDRFAIVNIAAGIIVSSAPFIFGIFYARYTRKNPGPSADATIALPITARLAAPTDATVPDGTRVRQRGIRARRLGRSTRIPVPGDIRIRIPCGAPVSLADQAQATLPPGATVTLKDKTLVGPHGTLLLGPTQVQLPAGADQVRLLGATALALNGIERTGTVLLTRPTSCELRQHTAVALPDGTAGVLTRDAHADLPAGALVILPGQAMVTLPIQASVTLAENLGVTLDGARPGAILPPETPMKLDSPAALKLDTLDSSGQVVQIIVVSGAAIAVLAGAIITWLDGTTPKSAAVQAGKTIQVSAGSTLRIPAGVAIALPGGSDIPMPAGGAISLGGGASTLAVAGGDLVPSPGSTNSSSASAQAQPPDLIVTGPACISMPGGAKITVTGSADIKIPTGTVIMPPRYRQSTVLQPRELQVPQASNVITGNLKMALIAAAVTMFGIGAEFGIAAVLAFGLSAASQFWRSVMLVAIVGAGLGVLYYAVTAIAALADPQPGSSLSSRSGTSFTL